MVDTPAPEKHEFKAEVAAVLRLVTNSLYTNREIFLRELVSNASDALDKARFEALVDKDLEGQELEPEIRIVADKARGVLVIEDDGIGMTREEAAHHLGTIAHSGTLAFLERATREQADGKKPDLGLIGQFGVGFYSAFMVADRIDVYTRSAHPGHEAVHWHSDGGGGFTVAPTERAARGTRIEVHLEENAREFLDRFRVESIVKRYSNFVMYPIRFKEIDAEGNEEAEWKQLNEVGAFWTRDPKSLEDSDYEEFYRHVMGGFVLPGDKPLARLHLSADAPIQFQAVLFVPGRRPADLFAEDSRHLQLYARRVMVMDNCDKLLPAYLRFVRGVVDSEDLPLNVSREMLQENRALAAIRRQLTRRVLKLLAEKAESDAETYRSIWEAFGVFLKEGLHVDNAHRDELTALLRFATTAAEGDEERLVSLAEYVEAMPEGQEAIYYITGENAAALARSPHLEACRARGYAVLLMTDAVDEWVVQDLSEYQGKPLRSVTQGELGLEPAAEGEAEAEAETPAELAPLLEQAREQLGERITEVRASKRLTHSASCLVDSEGGLGRNMERILKMAGREVPVRPRILELNPEHSFVQAAARLARDHADDSRLADYVELLYDQANLAEGSVPDPAGTVARIQRMLDRLVAVEHE